MIPMKIMGLALLGFFVVCTQIQGVGMINDSFVLDNGIDVTVKIDGDGSLLTIEVSVTNHSAEKVMLDNIFLRRYRPVLTDENGSDGKLIRSPSDVPPVMYTPAGIIPEDIDTLNVGETKTYGVQWRYEQTDSSFALLDPPYSKGNYNLFENPQAIKIVVSYKSYRSDIWAMRQFNSDIPIMPDFRRTYTLAEFGQ